MAKLGILKKNGVTIYPLTVTPAVLDPLTQKDLPTLLSEIKAGIATVDQKATAGTTGLAVVNEKLDIINSTDPTQQGSLLKVATDAKAYSDQVLVDAKAYTDLKVTQGATKDYVDLKCADTLLSAKSYTDTKASSTLASSKSYTDSKASITLSESKTYTDNLSLQAVNTAKTYTDSKTGGILEESKTYTDTSSQAVLVAAMKYTDEKSIPGEILNQAKEYTDVSLAWNVIS